MKKKGRVGGRRLCPAVRRVFRGSFISSESLDLHVTVKVKKWSSLAGTLHLRGGQDNSLSRDGHSFVKTKIGIIIKGERNWFWSASRICRADMIRTDTNSYFPYLQNPEETMTLTLLQRSFSAHFHASSISVVPSILKISNMGQYIGPRIWLYERRRTRRNSVSGVEVATRQGPFWDFPAMLAGRLPSNSGRSHWKRIQIPSKMEFPREMRFGILSFSRIISSRLILRADAQFATISFHWVGERIKGIHDGSEYSVFFKSRLIDWTSFSSLLQHSA